jgi:hypothetical protein
MDADSDTDLITSITPNVMTCLHRSKFFERLDDILSPSDGSRPRKICGGTYELSEAILQESGFESADVADIYNVLRSQGGFCDCEILYNATESSRLKAEYWRERARGVETQGKHIPPSPSAS